MVAFFRRHPYSKTTLGIFQSPMAISFPTNPEDPKQKNL